MILETAGLLTSLAHEDFRAICDRMDAAIVGA